MDGIVANKCNFTPLNEYDAVAHQLGRLEAPLKGGGELLQI